jgi:hypothetical protein
MPQGHFFDSEPHLKWSPGCVNFQTLYPEVLEMGMLLVPLQNFSAHLLFW